MTQGRRAFSAALATLPWMLNGTAANAQASAWPSRPIRLVVPYPPGGASDISGRLQAEVLAKALGTPVVVDNRAGAGGTPGTAYVAKSAPDGYTVMMASPSSHLGAPMLFRSAGYEGVDDFTAIATFSLGTAVVCVNPALPIKNIQELIAYAKANPGKLNFGSAGAGGANHMLGVLFMQRTGTELTHVPYRGAAQALVDLIAGNIQVVFDSFSGIIGAIRLLPVPSASAPTEGSATACGTAQSPQLRALMATPTRTPGASIATSSASRSGGVWFACSWPEAAAVTQCRIGVSRG